MLRYSKNHRLELPLALSIPDARRLVGFPGAVPEPRRGQRREASTRALAVVLDVHVAEALIDGRGHLGGWRPACRVVLEEQVIRRMFLVGDEKKEWRREAVSTRRALDRVDHLRFVELFAGEAGDALALLHEPDERRLAIAPGHFDEIVHEIAVQSRRGGHHDVVAPVRLQLSKADKCRLPAVPGILFDKLEKMVMQRRQSPGRLRLERNRPATLGCLIAKLHYLRAGG